LSLFVTDTHPLVWYVEERHSKLSRSALRDFNDASDGRALIYIPVIVMAEIAMLEERGRIELHEPFRQWAGHLATRAAFDILPLDLNVIAEARDLTFSKDWFDRLIVACARVNDLPLITKDSVIAGAGVVDIVW
jgi:PIN domain nuclease of toxin-antitoxin system